MAVLMASLFGARTAPGTVWTLARVQWAEAAGGDCIFRAAEVFTVHLEKVFVFWH